LTYSHIEELLRFAISAQSGRSLPLPGEVVARKEFDWLVLGWKPICLGGGGYAYSVNAPGEVTVSSLGVTFVLKIVEAHGFGGEYNKETGTAMDAEKVPGPMFLRNWRAGDRFWPSGSRKLRKLKELFRQQKIPRGQRKLWPVLDCGGEIVWVRGFPPAARVVACPESRALLIIEERAG
jgi:tRNA(Ile)-lysidine synthase